MFKLVLTGGYIRRSEKFFKIHPEILKQYEKVLKLVCLNPQHPSLRLHKLKGAMNGLFSISVNLSYRLIIYFIIKEGKIIPVDLGAHDEVY